MHSAHVAAEHVVNDGLACDAVGAQSVRIGRGKPAAGANSVSECSGWRSPQPIKRACCARVGNGTSTSGAYPARQRMSTGHVRRRIHVRHARRSTAAWSTAVFPSRSVSADRWSRLVGGRPGWFPPEFGWVVGCSYRGTPAERTMVRHFIGGNMSLRRRLVVESDGFDWHDSRGPALDAVGARRRRRRDVRRHRMLARRSRCPIRQLERECQEYGGRVTDLPPCSLMGSINAEARPSIRPRRTSR
jgi:hypothetical protein